MSVLFHLARYRLPIAVVVVSSVLMIAGCGSSSTSSSTSPSNASSSRTSPSRTSPRSTSPSHTNKPSASSYAQSQLKWAACIRSHGISRFPDPTFGGGYQVNLSVPRGVMTWQQFEVAEKACAKLGLIGAGGYAATSTATAAEMAQALASAECISAHGVPTWPDPSRTLPQDVPPGYNPMGAVPGPPGGPMFLIPDSINIAAPAVKQALKACHET